MSAFKIILFLKSYNHLISVEASVASRFWQRRRTGRSQDKPAITSDRGACAGKYKSTDSRTVTSFTTSHPINEQLKFDCGNDLRSHAST